MPPSLGIVSVHNGHFPLCFADGHLYSRKGHRIYIWDDLESPCRPIDRLDTQLPQRLLASLRPLERLLRFGLSHFTVAPNRSQLAILNKRVYRKASGDRSWTEIGSFSRLSRPMRFGVCSTSDNRFLIGEYFSNPFRRSVSLWEAGEHGHMEIRHQFPNGSIRHIHAVQEDPFTREIWVCTGDYGHECRILASPDAGRSFALIGEGDQSWRTCCLLFREDAVIWGMDSPAERSMIVRWDRAGRERAFLAELPGPIWHGSSNDDGWATFSTAVEPSVMLTEAAAHLWTSPDGVDFHPLASFAKDPWSQAYFQFGLIYFPTGNAPSNYLVFSGNALKDYENTMVIARLLG